MILQNRITTVKGEFKVEYHDADDFLHLPANKCRQSYGICLYQDLIIACKTIRGTWSLPGGSIEEGETAEQALVREVHEESNMKVLSYQPIGYQKVWNSTTEPFYQLRYYCVVEPHGPFERDTAESGAYIESIWQILPDQMADLLNWGAIGDRLIERALQMHRSKK